MIKENVSHYFYNRLFELADKPKIDQQDLLALNRLMHQLFELVTQDVKVHLNSLFTRMAYTFQVHQTPPTLVNNLHWLRISISKSHQIPLEFQSEIGFQGLRILSHGVSHLFDQDIPTNLLETFPKEEWTLEAKKGEKQYHQKNLKVVVTAIHREEKSLIVYEEKSVEPIVVKFDQAGINDHFNPSIRLITQLFRPPFQLYLLDCKVRNNQIIPSAFVLEPDHLFGVTDISECFKPEMDSPMFYLLKRLSPFSGSMHLILGNTANYILDELIRDSTKSFEALIKEIFHLYPFAFSLRSDTEIKQFALKAKTHYQRLKHVIQGHFKDLDIRPEDSSLEPTFYSPTYGIQGRLDVLHQTEAETSIIELKSGRTFKPNGYKLNRNHYTQTLLYDLLIKSAFGDQTSPKNYILYSGESEDQSLLIILSDL